MSECERCEGIPTEVLDDWRKAKRIKELKAELHELEKKPGPQPRTPAPRTLGCGRVNYPSCCAFHTEENRLNTPA